MAGNNIRFGAWLDDHVSSSLSKIRDKFDLMGKGAASASLVGNVGALALAKGIGIASMAAGRLVDVMGDAVESALADEESQARLGAALRANIPGWNGNTDAIEANIKSKQRLGFEDDELRDSLALLTAATGDVGKAQAIQNTAMDLARFKNIDLKTATEALTKVEAGSYRILKGLGIELKEGATQTEALAAVQKVAAGSAEALANTNRGKLTASQIKLNESMEQFGAKVMPAVIAVATTGADALSALADTVDILTSDTDDLNVKLNDNQRLFFEMEKNALKTVPGLGLVIDVLDGTGEAADTTAVAFDRTSSSMAEASAAAAAAKGPVSTLGDKGKEAGDKSAKSWKGALKALDDYRIGALTHVKTMIDDVFDPLILQTETLANATELADARRVIADKNASKEQKTAARDTLLSVGKDQAENLRLLAEAGLTGTKAYKDGMTSVTKTADVLDTKFSGAGTAIRNLVAAIKKIPPKTTVAVIIRTMQQAVGNGMLEFATGGVVPGRKGEPQLAIVHGGETVIPTGQPGYNGPVSLGGMSSGGGVVINYNVMYSTASVSEAQAFARAITPELTRELRRQRIVA